MEKPTIGVLAGMGPASTAPFLDLLLNECRRQYGAHHDIDYPKILICSQPAPFFHDRPNDHAAMVAATLSGLRDLEKGGSAL
jgi:aspartate racemase